MIDLDPQTNATFSCIDLEVWEKHAEKNGTVADLLGARRHTSAEGKTKDATTAVVKDVFPKVDLIPSHLDLFTVDLDLAAVPARERRLEKSIREIVDSYDVIVCDCPPNLTIPTQNALAMSSHYVVPISPDYLSGIGVGLLLNRIRELSDDLENDLDLAGIVISRVGRPARHRNQSVTSIRKQFDSDVLPTVIRERVKVSESAAKKLPIFDMGDPEASHEFSAVSRTILKRIGVKK